MKTTMRKQLTEIGCDLSTLVGASVGEIREWGMDRMQRFGLPAKTYLPPGDEGLMRALDVPFQDGHGAVDVVPVLFYFLDCIAVPIQYDGATWFARVPLDPRQAGAFSHFGG